MDIDRGLVHVYTGDGKGKTTAALGLALRVLGWGGRVCMVQFVKGYADIGEAHFADVLEGRFVLRQFASDSSRAIDSAKVTARVEEAQAAMDFAEQTVLDCGYDLVILDEVNNAVHYKLIPVDRVLSLLERKPDGVEVVLTGRGAPDELLDAADYVTEMRQIKHPYTWGVPAREGIDY